MRETKTLKGLFPDPKPIRRKNFIKENVKNLKRMEQLFHNKNKRSKSHDSILEDGFKDLKLEANNHQKKLAIRKKSDAGLVRKKIVNDRKLKSKMNADGDNASKEVAILQLDNKRKSQGVQTLDTKDLDNMHPEGKAREPLSNDIQNPESKSGMENKQSSTDHLSESKDEMEQVKFATNESVDFIKLNKQRVSVANKLANQLASSVPPPSHCTGQVPKYIKKRKEAMEKEKKEKLEKINSDCPIGHIVLPDKARQEMLDKSKKRYKDCINELNSLPIRSDTLKSQRRKMEIEQELVRLEETIKLFSRPKVFVALDS